ncbi:MULTISPECIES: DUF4139 domain-containing protein [unclassified Brevundimonas]|uniref:DUF4139 domain-containing protein n=1 Tax=unclassified Brevundimonas TaxID=2622653 RepID=UPI000CFA962B|nr:MULTISPECIES: DUF4139 domain-containing protein [unclassified Brevundimonas]PRA20366.1 hypothetical protein CQ024_16555 [Brevundimonas sp. MYb27]PQZ74060.1 hypothetical protein CQ026_15795 [Brevundimonas sp. MYb31]PRB10810.1 hypothetical protein CQ039_16000 [Brevundimonas sp. MYb52]PRB32402.1 hypothetical protein CQ035_15975 [Brevundimonas sp. MYb46]PRB50297.1 hypothetical protein CQ028_07725 [Brevundimonas sp. MYb33]
MRRLLAISTALTVLAPTAWAQSESVSVRPDTATVVIYRDQPVDTVQLMEQSRQPWSRLDREGLALIVETRTVDLPAGEGIIRFRGLATGVVPQSAVLEGLPAHVVERNADFDLLSPASLMEKSVGEVVRVVRTNPATGEQVEKTAVIRAGAQGTVLEIDGRFEALDCSGQTERVIFDRVPEGLGDQPVLSVRTRAEKAGRHTVTLAYLATGLQWSADYVARLDPSDGTLDLTGWVTLANFSGTGFPDAPVQVVAGTLRKDEGTVPVEPMVRYPQTGCWPQGTTTLGSGLEPTYKQDRVEYNGPPVIVPGPPPPPAAALQEVVVTGTRVVRQGELGDYKIYTLPEPTTVAARQTKQVRFLEREGVAYERVYRADVQGYDDAEARPTAIVLKLKNEESAGLGVALPGGSVAVMQPDGAGGVLLAGQDRFEDKGVGLPVRLSFGESPDVQVQTRLVKSSSSTRGAVTTDRSEIETTVTNARSEPVTVELVADAAMSRGFRIRSQSLRSRIDDTGYPVWTLSVPANGAATLKAAWTTTD